MRYMVRVQRTSLGFLHDVFYETVDEEIGPVILQYSPTGEHKGDHFTKDSLTVADFEYALVKMRVHPSLGEFKRGECKYMAKTPLLLAKLLAEAEPK